MDREQPLPPTCSHCQCALQPGISQLRNRPRWIEGGSFDAWGRPVMRGLRSYWIEEFRCPRCGRLERFATERLPGSPMPELEPDDSAEEPG